jgi:copper(I)-binding protein
MLRGLNWGIAAVAFVCGPHFAFAEDSISIARAWVRPSLGDNGSSALYFTVTNTGVSADAITSVAVTDAGMAELHATSNDNGVVGMRALAEVPVPPGASVRFEPKGDHVMLMGLKRQLKAGDHLTVTIGFKAHAPITLEAIISMTAPPQ